MTLEELKQKTILTKRNGKLIVDNAGDIIKEFMMMPIDERKQITEEYVQWLATLNTSSKK